MPYFFFFLLLPIRLAGAHKKIRDGEESIKSVAQKQLPSIGYPATLCSIFTKIGPRYEYVKYTDI